MRLLMRQVSKLGAKIHHVDQVRTEKLSVWKHEEEPRFRLVTYWSQLKHQGYRKHLKGLFKELLKITNI